MELDSDSPPHPEEMKAEVELRIGDRTVVMATARTTPAGLISVGAVGYNVQIAVDAKHKLIVEQEVTNQVVDMGLLKQTAEPAREILDVAQIDVAADRGYVRTEDIEACEKAGLIPHVPKPQRGPAVRNGFFRKDEFRYDADRNVYVCPAGEVLSPHHVGKSRDLKKIDYSKPDGFPRLSPARAMHDKRPTGLTAGERSGFGPDGRTPEDQARAVGSAPRDRRAPVRFDQTMDEPGRLSDARSRQCPRRVQSYRACL
jgi:hypothetical protein